MQKLIDALKDAAHDAGVDDWEDIVRGLAQNGLGSSDSSDPPKNVCIGCINPRALTEALLGRPVDWQDEVAAKKIMEIALETQHDELYDMKHNSPLYAGLKLENGNAVKMDIKDLKKIKDEERATPNLGNVKKLADLEHVGVHKFEDLTVQSARVENGKLLMKLDVPVLDHSISNKVVTEEFKSITIYDEEEKTPGPGWTPPNSSWIQGREFFQHNVPEFSDAIQGAVGDCWLMSALSAVAWSLPYHICHQTGATHQEGEKSHMNNFKFYQKGYGRDGRTDKSVEVSDKFLVYNGNRLPLYARSNDMGEIWPALYEKAFARWTGPEDSDEPNMVSLAGGDPALATAQLTDRKAHYYDTASRSDSTLWGLVRAHSRGYKTFDPMTCWTYASGSQYTYGSGIAANHAYTILGWAFKNSKMYMVLRNPWGYFETSGGNTYNGVLQFLDESFWNPIRMIPNCEGVFAIEATSFKHYFQYIGVAL